jgi:hypothetical protein
MIEKKNSRQNIRDGTANLLPILENDAAIQGSGSQVATSMHPWTAQFDD